MPSLHLSLVRYLLFSGLLGFSVFCISYAAHVWKRRNQAVGMNPHRAGTLRFWSLSAIAVGVLLVVLAATMREVLHPAGLLSSNQLFTLRAEKDLQAEFLVKQDQVKKGEVIARISSPASLAEQKQLTFQKA